MNVKDDSFIMESSFQFATMNSLTKNDKIQSKACAIYTENLEKHLQDLINSQYSEMKKHHEDVHDFFVTQARDILDNGWKKRLGWNFVFLTVDAYNEFEPQKDYFLAFKPDVLPNKNLLLFVTYSESASQVVKKQQMVQKNSKSDQILEQQMAERKYYYSRSAQIKEQQMAERKYSKSNQIKEQQMAKRKYSKSTQVHESLSRALNELTVNMILSERQNIGIMAFRKYKTFLNFCITLPEEVFENDLMYSHYQFKDLIAWKESIYDPQFMCMCLEKMGMKDVRVGEDANFIQTCDFKLPPPPSESSSSGNYGNIQQCQIIWNFNRLYESERLILAYLGLDKRVRPLVNAVNYFTFNHKIKCRETGLSTYAYIILVLHFLMHGLTENPVIPSFHDDIKCNYVKDCLYHKEGKKVILIQVLEEFQHIKLVSYHDCVKSVNHVTKAFTPPPLPSSAGDTTTTTKQHTTIWHSNNIDDVGSLLIQFFSYYSVKSHFKRVYFTNQGLGEQFLISHHKSPVSIQHHLRLSENAGKRCSEKMLDVIVEKFAAAAKMLKSGKSYKEICEM